MSFLTKLLRSRAPPTLRVFTRAPFVRVGRPYATDSTTQGPIPGRGSGAAAGKPVPPSAESKPTWTDPRPPWVFRSVSWATWLLIPTVAVYFVLYVDFGDSEHVYMPIRRWVMTQKSKVFELSPAELEMVHRKVVEVGPKETRLKEIPKVEPR